MFFFHIYIDCELWKNKNITGKMVVVKYGPYKGHYGFVKDVIETAAKVELHASCQTININTNRLKEVGSRPSCNATPLNNISTPSYSGSKTPVYGSQTPTHDGLNT